MGDKIGSRMTGQSDNSVPVARVADDPLHPDDQRVASSILNAIISNTQDDDDGGELENMEVKSVEGDDDGPGMEGKKVDYNEIQQEFEGEKETTKKRRQKSEINGVELAMQMSEQ